MKRSVKRNLIAVFSMLAVGALTATGVNAISANALELTDTANNFYVVDGASVLYKAAEGEEKAQAGIRFQAVMTEEYYAVATGTAVTYGIELYSALNDTLLTTVDCTENITLSAKGHKQNGEDLGKNAYVFNASVNYGELTGDSARLAYAFDMYAKAYVEIDGTKTYAASNQTVRSMSEVAKNAYNDNASEYYENETLGAYFQNLTEATETAIVASLPDEADDKQVTIAGLKDDQGTKKAYVGGTELTEVTFDGDNVVLSDTDAAKVKVAQNYALTVLSDSGKTYAGTFSGITKYIDDTDFITVLRDTTLNIAENSFMFDGDVNLTESHFTLGKNQAGDQGYVYYVIEQMKAGLDGNGYNLNVNADLSIKNAGSVFFQLMGVMKNITLNYNAKRMAETHNMSCLAMWGDGGANISDCYFNANIVVVNKADGTLAQDITVPMIWRSHTNSKYTNCVFNMEVVGGTPALQGAFYGQPWYINCAFIGNKTFDLDSGMVVKTIFCYDTMDDFVAGENGFERYVQPNFTGWEREINHSVIPYMGTAWNGQENNLYLNGKQVDVEPTRTVTATITGADLTITDTSVLNVYEIYVGETLFDTVVGSVEAIPNMLEKAGLIKAGENAIEFTVKTVIGGETVATVAEGGSLTMNVFGINDANFVSTAQTAQANVSSSYYILIEDVALDASDYNVSVGNDSYVVRALYIDLDGNGHTLSVSGDLSSTTRSAVFYDVIGSTIQNLVFKYNVTRKATLNLKQGCFANNLYVETCLYNCYMEANVTPVYAESEDTTVIPAVAMFGNMTIRHTSAAATQRASVYSNTIISVNILNTDGTVRANGYLHNTHTNGPVVNDWVFIESHNTSNKANVYSTSAAWYKNMFLYTSLANFISGTGYTSGTAQVAGANLAWTATTAKAYTSWSNVWTIDETGIKLCGRTVYTVPAQA